MRAFWFAVALGGIGLATACTTHLYTVQTAPGSSEMTALMYYWLPRTDLRLATNLSVRTLSYGEYYCFGKKNRIGDGACKPDVCKKADKSTVTVESVGLEALTVPDQSQLYVYQIPRTREAAKRKATVAANQSGIILGADAEYESHAARITLQTLGTVAEIVGKVFRPPLIEGAVQACEKESAAAKVAREVHDAELCIDNLRSSLSRNRPTSTGQFPVCKSVAELEPKQAIKELLTQVARKRAKFGVYKTRRAYAVEQWIQVEKEETTGGTTLIPGRENALGVCFYMSESNPAAAPRIAVCPDGTKEMYLRTFLQRLPGSNDAAQTTKLSPPFGGGGLVYRLPLTALLHLEVTRPASEAGEKPDDVLLRARQMKAVAFPQLGDFNRAPRDIKSKKGHVLLKLSPETGMLTKVEYSREPEPASDEAAAASVALKTLAGDVAASQEKPSAADLLEEQNRMLRLQIENACLQEGRTDCDEAQSD